METVTQSGQAAAKKKKKNRYGYQISLRFPEPVVRELWHVAADRLCSRQRVILDAVLSYLKNLKSAA